RRAERLFPEKGVVTATAIQGGDGGPVRERVTYGEWAQRTRRLAGAFDALGISADGRVATFAWNTARHLELYFAAPCSGRVLHTLNIRLFPEQLTYIANHAEDEVVFVDRSLLGLLWPLVGSFETVKHYVVMDDGKGDVPDDPRVLRYEDLLAGSEPVEFEVDDESRAAAMCYTSGTTGNPKGVVYSHRSTVLHSMATMLADTIAVSEADVVLPVVPMFHANAWGLAHAAVFAGANLVFPGPDLSPLAIVDVRISAPDGGDELAWDGVTSGELQVRGPWIAATYYNDPRADESFTKDGWLRTGDVAVISPEGYIRLVDRTKDLVKSGGEWIS